jgi:hypothetical protein
LFLGVITSLDTIAPKKIKIDSNYNKNNQPTLSHNNCSSSNIKNTIIDPVAF